MDRKSLELLLLMASNEKTKEQLMEKYGHLLKKKKGGRVDE